MFCTLTQSLKVNSGFKSHCPSSIQLEVWAPAGSICAIWERVKMQNLGVNANLYLTRSPGESLVL